MIHTEAYLFDPQDIMVTFLISINSKFLKYFRIFKYSFYNFVFYFKLT